MNFLSLFICADIERRKNRRGSGQVGAELQMQARIHYIERKEGRDLIERRLHLDRPFRKQKKNISKPSRFLQNQRTLRYDRIAIVVSI